MILPHKGDYIDIHTHEASPEPGLFIVENLMAHEGKTPGKEAGLIYTVGIHPWHLDESNHHKLVDFTRQTAMNPRVYAIGEAGFDKLKGASPELQRRAFGEQVTISEELEKPLIIHCVRAWDQLFAMHRKLKPVMPWLVHGFRGRQELARQITSRGMFISFWFDFILRPESAALVRSIDTGRIFLETDGSGARISDIYEKVASDLDVQVEVLKKIIRDNFMNFFGIDG